MNPFDPFPTLTTSRLLLRSLALTDAEGMFQVYIDPATARFSGKPPPASVDVIREKIEKILATIRSGDAISWALVDAASDAYIGSAGLFHWDKTHFRAEIGYEIAPDFRGRGLMTEALRPILALGFERMKLHTVEAKLNPENTASSRVLEKLGFRKEAHFRENHWNGSGFEDTAVYSLIAPG